MGESRHHVGRASIGRYREVAPACTARTPRAKPSSQPRRAVAAHLQARGVSGEIADEALPQDGETELAAALAFTRRRRIGAFRREEVEADEMKAIGMLARAGFSRAILSASCVE